MPELTFFRRGEEVLRVGLEHRRVVLGRSGLSDVVIPDPHVSRQHVALHFNGTHCLLEDLSGQGTLVTGQLMRQGELRDGAALVLGQWCAVYRHQGSGAEVGPTSARTDIQAPHPGLEARGGGLPRAQLRVRQGTTELLHELGEESFTVGSDPSNAVVIQDRFVSGRHLQVTRHDTTFHVRDLNSTNGTYLDEVRVYEVQVPLNTVLRLGRTQVVFEPASRAGPEQPRHGLIGKEPAMRQVLELIQRVAPSTATVLILGESGTGKELVARALHDGSTRAMQPFVPVNCAALSPALIESELFGHEKGAFTGADCRGKGAFEEADGGTLFLDEVGELPLELQAKLLRVLENGEVKRVGSSRPFQVDVRVVAATNRDLLKEARQGRFRMDLYYRLSVVPLSLPPLRERRKDLRQLAEHFLRLYTPREQTVKFTPAALARLEQHAWPGNVRELRNVVFRALLLRQGQKLEAGLITFEEESGPEPGDMEGRLHELPEGMTLEQRMQQVERQLIESTLRRCNHHKDKAARLLGIARSSLFERLKKWGNDPGEEEA